MAFLEINGASKAFRSSGEPFQVLSDINLQVNQGEFLAIVGYSGTGKTTLINLLAGLVRPDVGTVRKKGAPIVGPGPDRGLVFQNYSLLPWMSVFGNVHLAVAAVHPELSRAEKKERAEKFIEMVNLTPARHKKPHELSGGMKQRVSVARALAMDPEVLLLDEPLGALDALTRAVLQDEIVRIWEASRKTVVLITNDVDEAILMADRIVPLKPPIGREPGEGATLGPSFAVALPRPRDRTALNHNTDFKAIRNRVTNFLIDVAPRLGKGSAASRPLPNLKPIDLVA